MVIILSKKLIFIFSQARVNLLSVRVNTDLAINVIDFQNSSPLYDLSCSFLNKDSTAT